MRTTGRTAATPLRANSASTTSSAPIGTWGATAASTPASRLVVMGSVPTIVVVAWLRVHVLSEPRSLKAIAGIELFALAVPVILPARHRRAPRYQTQDEAPHGVDAHRRARRVLRRPVQQRRGSLLAPLFVAYGVAVTEVAGAALVATFTRTLAGLLADLASSNGGARATPYSIWA